MTVLVVLPFVNGESAMVPKGRGPDSAKIMIVGEAWGRDEEREGLPFVGSAGRLLNELLLKAGINPDACYYTNLVNQRPPENDLSTWFTRGIPNEIVLEGLESLEAEIARVQPNVIVPVGNWPLWAFYHQPLNKKFQPTGILDYRGYVLEARSVARGQKIIPTVHPSYILRGGYSDAPLAILDLRRAREEAAFPEIRRKPRQAIVDPRGAEREAIGARLLNEGRYLCLDIEYIGSHLLCVGFAVSSNWAVTIRIRSPEDVAWCRRLIQSGRPILAQNAMFDLGILDWHYHIDAFEHLRFDTMVAAYNINIEAKKDLGFLGSMYTDLPAWWDGIDWERIKAGLQPVDDVLEYNCYDCMATYEIAEKQEVELDLDPKMREAFEFDMAKIPALWRMARRGVPLDTEHLRNLRIVAENDVRETQLAINETAEALGMDLGGVDLNVKSPDQVAMFLFVYLGAPAGSKTTGGSTGRKKLKTDNVTLMESMRKVDDKMIRNTIGLVIRCREARDLISKTLEIEWDDDNRSRCIYDSTKTTTRRLSSKKFFPTGKGSNLQNIPAPGSSKYGKEVRRGLRADTGMEFGYADLKGAEFLIVAEETQDPLMLRYAQMSIDGSGDVHRETAAFIFSRIRGVELKASDFSKDSPERFLGKKTRHSGNYMVGWKELMGRINAEAMETGVFVDAATMKQILEGYHELHPGLREWYRETEYKLRTQGLLRNWFGYPRRFFGRWAEILPAAVAFVPQSTVGDCLNYGLLACENDEQLRDAGFELLLNVHDAIGFQYPVGSRDEVIPRVNDLMSIPLTVPRTGNILRIPVEIAVGPNWGDLEEYKIHAHV